MSNNGIIQKFLENKKVVLIGASRNSKKFGNIVFKTLIDKGFEVIPVNPNVDNIDGIKCYNNLKEINSDIKNLIVITPKNVTKNIIQQVIELNGKFENIWIQQGSDTKESIELLEENKINYIAGQCILMYANPSGFHKFHQTIAKLFGMYKN